jgi:hypothetical protein
MGRGWCEWQPLTSDESRSTWQILVALAAWAALFIGGLAVSQ